jgi:hypothetical protein
MYTRREYTQVYNYLPEIKSGNFEIKHFQMTKDEVKWEMVKNMRDYWLVSGLQYNYTYTKLILDGQVWMSDTPMERNTNRDFLTHAYGDVLIFGLGIGLIVYPLLSCPNIKSITVIEKDQGLIDLVTPELKKHDPENKLQVYQGDAFWMFEQVSQNPLYKNKPKDPVKFDTIYFDIWVSICQDNYDEIKELERKYRKFLNKSENKFMSSWMKDYYQRMKREESRESRRFSYW